MPHAPRSFPSPTTPRFSFLRQHWADHLVRLDHAEVNYHHIARLMDVLDEPSCLLYEYVAGQTLDQYLDDRGYLLDQYEAFEIADQILSGLSELHRAGVIHRDLHPGNIMIVGYLPSPLVKILDCGVAWPRGFWGSYDPTKQVPYISVHHDFAEPEAIMPPDELTDLYSVGILIWWMIVGGTDVPEQNANPLAEQLEPVIALVRSICAGPRDNRLPTARSIRRRIAQPEQTPIPGVPGGAESVAADGSGTFSSLEEALKHPLDGTVLYLEDYEYTFSKPLVVRADLSIIGKGAKITRLIYTGSGPAVIQDIDGMLSISDLSIIHTGTNRDAIIAVEGGNLSVERCHITGEAHDMLTDNSGTGIRLTALAQATLAHCSVSRNSGNGVEVHGYARLIMHHSDCSENGGSGVVFDSGSHGEISDSTFHGNGMLGIYCRDESSAMLSANACRENGQGGIAFLGKSHGAAERNDCSLNDRTGIDVEDDAALTVTSNTCDGNVDCGIAYAGLASGEARNNRCGRNGKHGICVEGDATAYLHENTCSNNLWSGIAFLDSARGDALLNHCQDNGHYGLYVHQTAILESANLETNNGSNNGESTIGDYRGSDE